MSTLSIYRDRFAPRPDFSSNLNPFKTIRSRKKGESRAFDLEVDRFDPPRVPIIRYHAPHKSADNVQHQPTNGPIFRRHPLLDTPWPGNIPAAWRPCDIWLISHAPEYVRHVFAGGNNIWTPDRYLLQPALPIIAASQHVSQRFAPIETLRGSVVRRIRCARL